MRVEWSFCKSSNASVFSLPSSVTGFDKVICGRVRIHSLSCLIRSASFLTLTQFSTYFRCRKTSLSTALCVTFQPPNPSPTSDRDPDRPWQSTPAWVIYFLSICISCFGISALNWRGDRVVMVTPRAYSKACCELRRLMSLWAKPDQARLYLPISVSWDLFLCL